MRRHSGKIALFLGLLGLLWWISGGGGHAGSEPPVPAPAPARSAPLAKGKVDLEGGLIRIASQRDGILREIYVTEGERVRKGQPLAMLENESARRREEIAAGEMEEIRREIRGLHTQLEAARRDVRRFDSLAREDLIPRQQMDELQDRERILRDRLAQAQATLSTQRSRVAQERYETGQYTVRAPLDGQILRCHVQPGDGVSTLNVTPLFLFAPRRPLILRAELDEAFLQEVNPGAQAQVSLDEGNTWPLEARVIRLGRTLGRRIAAEDPNERQDQRVREVVLDCPREDLLLGQRVLVRFPPDRRESVQ